jgi:hypothetical protein
VLNLRARLLSFENGAARVFQHIGYNLPFSERGSLPLERLHYFES